MEAGASYILTPPSGLLTQDEDFSPEIFRNLSPNLTYQLYQVRDLPGKCPQPKVSDPPQGWWQKHGDNWQADELIGIPDRPEWVGERHHERTDGTWLVYKTWPRRFDLVDPRPLQPDIAWTGNRVTHFRPGVRPTYERQEVFVTSSR